jgi:hypothetical protein
LRRAATPLARSTGAIQKVPILRASKLASESFEAPAIPPSSIGSVPVTIRFHGRKGSGVTETEKLRHYCRNPHCRMKLKAPVENDHAAFCCRGCFTRFYRRRCLVCERDLSRDPMTGEAVKLGRKFCGEMPERAQALPARL